MVGLCLDPCEPGADRGKRGKVEVAFMRQVGVGIEGDIGDAVTIGHKIVMVLEVTFHHSERPIAFLQPIFDCVLLQLAAQIERALAVYIQKLEHMRENLRTREMQSEFEIAAALAALLRK